MTEGVENRMRPVGDSTSPMASESSLTRSSAQRFRRVNSKVGCLDAEAVGAELDATGGLGRGGGGATIADAMTWRALSVDKVEFKGTV